ncbi:unnamed protein product [Discula destructiva]
MAVKTSAEAALTFNAKGDYKAPTKGVLSILPASWVPYAELIRFSQPHGIYMIYFPYIVGLMYAGSAKDLAAAALPPSVLLNRLAVLGVWTFFLRSAGCAWNDIVDQDFDRKTERCRSRPVARGAISTTSANIYALALILIGFATLQILPVECSLCAISTTALTVLYPFGKRFTNFPQVILGSVLSTAISLSSYSIGLPALSPAFAAPTLCLSATIVLLVIFYDTIYARQDTADDLKSGVKGMAVLFRNHIVGLLLSLTSSIAALLYTVGTLLGMHTYFFAFSVGGLVTGLFTMIALIKWHWIPGFEKYAGWAYALAILNLVGGSVSEYLVRSQFSGKIEL